MNNVFVLLLVYSCNYISGQLIVDKTCQKELGEDGWRCANGECITVDWVCDGYNQCQDDSDETLDKGHGCNLFPNSFCKSFNGKEHFYCPRTGDCFPNEEDAKQCNTTLDPIQSGCEQGQFKCKDGRCIKKSQVCDRASDCLDGSDETQESCYPVNNHPGDCTSEECSQKPVCRHFGREKYVPCPIEEFTDDSTVVCTPEYYADLAESQSNGTICRECNDSDSWRCNDGWCIKRNLTNNGIPDCQDGSDEASLPYSWWIVLLITTALVTMGLLFSFACRALGYTNFRSWFHCSLCSSGRSGDLMVRQGSVQPTAPNIMEMDVVDGKGDDVTIQTIDDQEEVPDPEAFDFLVDQDIPKELIRIFEDKRTYWDLEVRDQISANIHGTKWKPESLKSEYKNEAKKLYMYVHTDPLQLHHLYSYLVNRTSSVKELSKITNLLVDFEREIHGNSTKEVLKCWRLHIGCSETIKSVINSVSDNPSLCSRLYLSFLPLRNCVRKVRLQIFKARPAVDSQLMSVVKTIGFTLFPFIGASFLYFETIKNLVYCNIVYRALEDLSDGDMMKYPFEMFLFIFMLGSILASQFLCICYSVYYSDKIFEVSHEKSCNYTASKIFFKGMSVVLGPLIPCYVLANKAYYEARLDIQRRTLESFSHYLNDEECSVLVENQYSPSVDAAKKEGDLKKKIQLYRKIRQLECKVDEYRKIYSYYRVTCGVIESVTIIVVLVLLMFVTGRKGRDINLITGVEHRLRTFFGITTYNGSFLDELNLVRDFVIGSSLIYSFGMVTTALIAYWYQAKNECVSVGGWIILFAYYSSMIFNRLTTFISIFSVTQPLQFDNGFQEPKINLFGGVVIFTIIVIGHLVLTFWYKHQYSFNWSDGGRMDQWINVLVNAVAVVPFVVNIDPLKELKENEKDFSFSPEKKKNKKESLKRRQSLLKLNSVVESQRIQQPSNVWDMLIPNMNQFTAPFLYDDLRKEIRDQWWTNPRKNLCAEDVTSNIRDLSLKVRLQSLNKDFVEENIKLTVKQLEDAGYINKPLLNPAPTMREYFWLWIIFVAENLVALSVEAVNGGVWTSQGHYYSWDIRLVSLILGLLFLIMYYKKYHVLRELTTNPICGTWLAYLPVCCGCTQQIPMQAPPDEDAVDRVLNSGNGISINAGTQTDFIGCTREVQTEPYLPQIIESLPNIPSAPPIPPIGQNMPPKSAEMPQQILCTRCKHEVEDC